MAIIYKNKWRHLDSDMPKSDCFITLSNRLVAGVVVKILLVAVLSFTIVLIIENHHNVHAEPIVIDDALSVESVFNGLDFPTSMAFLGPDDILVLEKNKGTVQRIVNGTLLDKPLLDVNVANSLQRGMLGIAISKQESENESDQITHVFLYYTETKSIDGEDLKNGEILGNRLYRYDLVNNKLVNPKMLLDLPAEPGLHHTGGVVLIGPDENVYLVIGDIDHSNKAQNILNKGEPDGTSAIIRITPDGNAIQDNNSLGDIEPLNKYYAYGIRSSFGMDFDPVTGLLWDTENGDHCCDELNLVEQGFNSGWKKIQGVWQLNQSMQKGERYNETSNNKVRLATFDGKGKYSHPEFTWDYVVAPTSLKFLHSDKLGKQYRNDLLVANFIEEIIYHFDLTEDRHALLLNGTLADKLAEKSEDLNNHIFGKGFSKITDMDIGPDGNLYILSHQQDKSISDYNIGRIGSIYKIFKHGNSD
jgi:glucose/arabinose dehydrogenase